MAPGIFPEALTNETEAAELVVTQSKSKHWPKVLWLLKNSNTYRLFSTESQNVHIARYSLQNLSQLEYFAAALAAVHRWDGVELFVKGRQIRDIFSYSLTLECYARSFDFENPDHHCQKIVPYVAHDRGIHRTGPAQLLLTPAAALNKIEYYALPCQKAARTFHPSENWNLPMKERFGKHVRERERHCFVCPRYDENRFSCLGERPGLRLPLGHTPEPASLQSPPQSDCDGKPRHLPEPPLALPEC
jgi:hypothetical protein